MKPINFIDLLKQKNINFFTGVPDSLLKDFCLLLDESISEDRHIIAANEGNAIALASGYHLSTGELPLVYMQNSGLGNAIDPILSLCDTEVYSIPILLLIGWRGEPGLLDEPQHIKQGKIQNDLLSTLDIPYEIISRNERQINKKISNIINIAIEQNRPVAVVVKKGTFDENKSIMKSQKHDLMSREDSLKIILNSIPQKSIIISTTGKTSREIFEIREQNNESHEQDFLTVGSMGHCSSVALGIAISNPKSRVICIDGDGAMIMHMGSLSTVGKLKPKNFYHILINNQVHESVGGQFTSAKNINISKLANANSYNKVNFVDNKNILPSILNKFFNKPGPNFLEVKIKPGARKDLGRPTIDPITNKNTFMKFIKKYS